MTEETKIENTELLDDEEEILGSKTALFTCPNCGVVTQDDVIFTCNKCDGSELIFREGVYMCPECLLPGENFECTKCGSTKVTLTFREED